MNLRDALLATHETDRMPAEVDRRLRRRLGLESARAASPRRVWLIPAFAGLAAVAVIVVLLVKPDAVEPTSPPAVSSSSTVPASSVAATAGSASTETMTWRDASIVPTPGTRVRASDSALVLEQGEIDIQRTDTKPMLVEVPTGRVVIAAYRSSVKASAESVTIVVHDGTGEYTDATGKTHALVPGKALVQPPPASPRKVERAPVGPRARATEVAPPVETPAPTVAPRAGVACTFKSDCQAGQTCRKDEHGASVCMGNGSAGDACWFASDCVSQRCEQRRCTE